MNRLPLLVIIVLLTSINSCSPDRDELFYELKAGLYPNLSYSQVAKETEILKKIITPTKGTPQEVIENIFKEETRIINDGGIVNNRHHCAEGRIDYYLFPTGPTLHPWILLRVHYASFEGKRAGADSSMKQWIVVLGRKPETVEEEDIKTRNVLAAFENIVNYYMKSLLTAPWCLNKECQERLTGR
jgi:hypothetical protein